MSRSRRVAKSGWGPGEGFARSRQNRVALEDGSVGIKDKEKVVEKTEHSTMS